MHLAEPTLSSNQPTSRRRRFRSSARLGTLAGAAFAVLAAGPLAAQGATGAAIEGRVLTRDSTPVEQAIVYVVNTSNGERWETTTTGRGRYFLEYLSVGGPYRIEVRAVGYEPMQRDSVHLALGQRLTVHFSLKPAVVELQEISVSAADLHLSSARTGPAQVLSDSLIARLPVNRRDYTELAVLSPQITKSPNGGLSFAGQHDRYNNIQVDGAANSDPFRRSFSGNGPPGWFVGLTGFTPEAVKELQIVSAPFDVRYGSFAGGLVNAVTKSGTNRVEGSILGYFENAELTGTDATGSRAGEFSRKELGVTLGAPIVRDRLALFVNADLREEVIPQSVPVPTSDTTGGGDSAESMISYESLVRFQDLLRGYGIDPGSFSAGSSHNPTRNLFVKLTAQLGVNSRLAVSHNYGHGKVRDERLDRNPGYYPLSSGVVDYPETVNATRLSWTTAFASRFSNELIVARVDDDWSCLPSSDFPAVSITNDAGEEILAGTPGSCLGLKGGTNTWEVTDNFGMVAGNHRLTLGFHGERVHLVENPFAMHRGVWFFQDLDALERAEPVEYYRDLLAGVDSQIPFRVNQVGLYLQDQWLPTPGLTLTAGLRVDVPFVPVAPTQNPVALRELGVNTALTPSGNALWSPRLGVNYDLSGRSTTVLRGGVGLFSGPPPYVWFRNVYGSNGLRAFTINCTDGDVPDFTLDPANQPTACPESPAAVFAPTYFDPDFRFPRTLKLAVGVDQVLPGGVLATLDFLYTRGVNTVHSVDVNLVGPFRRAPGEGGRILYGTIDPESGQAEPARVSDAMPATYELRNGSGDRSYVVTAQLGKRFHGGTELTAAYTYTNAQDRMSMDHNIADLVTGSTAVDGTLEDRALRPSLWERPHKITLVGTTNLPLGLRFGLTYVGMSGAAYTYVALGDPNADGFRPGDRTSNDVVYVPRDADDIALAEGSEYADLDSFIEDEPCLQKQRGSLLQRNSCRDPWVHETAARMSKRFGLADRRALEVTADLFNLLNFLDRDWGLVRQTAGDVGNLVSLLNLVGYDTDRGRGVYELIPIDRRVVDADASRWRLQLGATLFF